MVVDDFLGLKFVREAPKADDKFISIPGAIGHVTIRSLICWCMTGKILPYANNRGNGKVSLSGLNSICTDGIKPDVIGECTYGVWKNDAGQTVVALNNFHTRMLAILSLYNEDKLSEEDLDCKVAFRVVLNDFIESYQALNAPGSAHRTKDKICNPDLAYGVHLKVVFDALSEKTRKFIGENKWTILSAILYNLGKNKAKDWYWPSVYRLRQPARYEADKKAGALTIPIYKINALVEAINVWSDIMLTLHEKNTNRMKIKKIIGSAGFFGYIVADQLGPKKLHESPLINANRIFSKYDKIIQFLPELTRGNDDTLKMFNSTLDSIFKEVKTKAKPKAKKVKVN